LRSLITSLLAAAFAAAPLSARPSDLPKPLRSLVYDLAVSIGIVRRTHQSPLSTTIRVVRGRGANGAAAVPRGAGGGNEDANTAALEARGSIAVDVIAATADGGLVVDMAEAAPGRNRAKVRFAVTADGMVAYDPKRADDVSEEELALGRWLARGFYGDHPRDAGAKWTIDQSGNGVAVAEHYRVRSADDRRVTLDYRLEEAGSGAGSFTATREGSLVYDTGLTVPLRATYEGATRRQFADAYDEMHTSIVLTLTVDSFAKKN
jgi:hypothetical protein